MTQKTLLLHAAVHCDTIEHAHILFEVIFGLEKIKTFSLDAHLSQAIFSINTPVDVIVFGNESTQIEVFIHSDSPIPSFMHICMQVPDKQVFLKRCRTAGLQPFEIEKGEKKLLFVKDYVGNLFEIKY
jgi:hypothetical protein